MVPLSRLLWTIQQKMQELTRVTDLLVEQEGYEQSIDYLNGGEKTSIALAYRLVLNTIVRKAATSMKSNLLILDERTDGFSKEQLLKMRDIFIELACPQVIIVSHERELESFADQIFRISKAQRFYDRVIIAAQ